MRCKGLYLGGVVMLAAALVSANFDAAEARRGGGWGGFRGGHAHFGGFRSYGGGFRRVAPFYAVPLVGYGAYRGYRAYYAGTGSCYWLRQRALATGSRYWWQRYRACINGY